MHLQYLHFNELRECFQKGVKRLGGGGSYEKPFVFRVHDCPRKCMYILMLVRDVLLLLYPKVKKEKKKKKPTSHISNLVVKGGGTVPTIIRDTEFLTAMTWQGGREKVKRKKNHSSIFIAPPPSPWKLIFWWVHNPRVLPFSFASTYIIHVYSQMCTRLRRYRGCPLRIGGGRGGKKIYFKSCHEKRVANCFSSGFLFFSLIELHVRMCLWDRAGGGAK